MEDKFEKNCNFSGVASVFVCRGDGPKLDRKSLLLQGSHANDLRPPLLPFGTRVRVTNLSSNRSVVLIVHDRGPYIRGRIIDASPLAADMLGFRHAGLAQVEVKTFTD